jgi:hypothetical protein
MRNVDCNHLIRPTTVMSTAKGVKRVFPGICLLSVGVLSELATKPWSALRTLRARSARRHEKPTG